MLFFAEAPNTAMVVTSIRPRVSAKAVAAVRRGLRTALVRASRPTVPNDRPQAGAEHADHRPGQRRRAEQHAHDQAQRAEPDQSRRTAAGPGDAADDQAGRAEQVATRPNAVRSRSEVAGRGELLAHRGHRSDLGGPPGGGVRAEQGDADADGQRHQHGAWA